MKTLTRLLKYLLPYRRGFATSSSLMLILAVTDLMLPLIFGWTVDRGLASRDMNRILLYAGMLIAFQAGRSVAMYFQWMVQQRVGQNVIRDLRDGMYQRLQALPISFYRSMPTGQIMSRVTSDVELVQEYIGWGFLLQLASTLVFISTLIVLFWIDWYVTLAITLPLIVMAVIVYQYDKRLAPAWEQDRETMGELNTVLQENVSGIRIVKAFARESLAMQQFRKRNDASRQVNYRRIRLDALAQPSLSLMIGLAFAVLALVGAQRVIEGELTIGTFFAYQWYIWGLIWPVEELGWLTSLMRQALAAAPRLWELFDADLIIEDPAQAVPMPVVSGAIRFDHVDFAFADEPDRPVLAGLDLAIAPGEIVAVMGSTGSGKSTLINLIPRLLDVDGGRVLIDGRDVRQMRLRELRRHIGIVPQESFLFSATIRENIAYGHPEATLDQVVAAAQLAQAHEFIGAMEAGYDTQIGERGVRLSGGQKQRLALARAILVDPAILILDEATSAVDTETEHEIQQALEQVMADRTNIIIAQRLSTIKHADRIVVLRDGRVAEEGSHESLLTLGGEYARIYNLQFREEDELSQELERLLAL